MGQQLPWQLLGGIGLAVGLVVLTVWGIEYFRSQPSPPLQPPISNASPQAKATPVEPIATDPFAAAVRLAEQASAAGKKAKTRVEWLDLAHQWQQASDLMGQVKADDSRYSTAQDRVQLYQQNSEAALQQAERLKS